MKVYFPKILHALGLKNFIKFLLSRKKFSYGKHCFVKHKDNLNVPRFMIFLGWEGQRENLKEFHIEFMKSQPTHLQPLWFCTKYTAFQLVFLQFPRKTFFYQIGDSFPKDYVIGVCRIFPWFLFVFNLSTNAACRLQYVLE